MRRSHFNIMSAQDPKNQDFVCYGITTLYCMGNRLNTEGRANVKPMHAFISVCFTNGIEKQKVKQSPAKKCSYVDS